MRSLATWVALLLLPAIASASYLTGINSKSYSLSTGTAGTYWMAGYYAAPAADANLTQASATINYGTASAAYAAHAFIVAGGAGSASGGSGSVSIVVTGTSINDSGTRTPGDSETIVADITALATDQYVEGPKKWLGQITYTLTCTGGCTHTSYSADFNYGLAKYDDINNTHFTIRGVECLFTNRVGSTEPNLNIALLKHQASGWTYSAAAFVPGNGTIASLATDHSTDDQVPSGTTGAWKRANLHEDVDGENSDGFILKVTTTVNNSIQALDCHVKWAPRHQ